MKGGECPVRQRNFETQLESNSDFISNNNNNNNNNNTIINPITV
jgi:hypothetical protein